MNLFGSANKFTWFAMSGLEATEPRLGRLNLANPSSWSIETFFSVSNEYVDGSEAKRRSKKILMVNWKVTGKTDSAATVPDELYLQCVMNNDKSVQGPLWPFPFLTPRA